ncbi:MAG: Gfo/Idh/MocA family oxidoreductase [Gemmatimonadales bacterium]|nr:Gfo/Idh/MocA family oxidoreductase [Gemmatimonadales bacterium]
MPRNRKSLSRRDFVAGAGKVALGAMVAPGFPTVVSRHVLGGPGFQAPSDTLNVAIVGAGGMGMSNAEQLVSQNIAAVCDVDFGYVERSLAGRGKDNTGQPRPNGLKLQEQFGKATRYADFREMLDKEKGVEGVVIATPDHNHAVIAKAAMEAGKHVYVQKPLTYSVHEARVLRETARRTGRVTQMGNQGHSTDDARLVNEWIQAGVIGPVREVYVWTNRPIWPQGISRPVRPPATPAAPNWGTGGVRDIQGTAMWGDYPIPAGLNWQLYLGPVAEEIAFHPIYHPFNWRGWLDFGVGALGDMGAHLIDHPYWALSLTQPTSIEATSTPFGTVAIDPPPATGPRRRPVSYPLAMTAHYEFPARGTRPPVKLSWFDGGLMPPRPEVLPDSVTLNREGGVIFLGSKGILMHETYGAKPTIFPDALMQEARAVPKTMARITTSHEMNWAEACKGKGQASSPFDYAAPLTETMLLGIVALRAGQGRKILYDADTMTITNAADANQYLTREYRGGWAI